MILKVTMKHFLEVPSADPLGDSVVVGSTHQGKSCLTRRRVWEIERLLEGGLIPGDNKIN
jgi:hypothetical protein